MTPVAVHYGWAAELHERRQQVPDAAYAAHPERFVRKRSTAPALPKAVWINPPKTTRGKKTRYPIVVTPSNREESTISSSKPLSGPDRALP